MSSRVSMKRTMVTGAREPEAAFTPGFGFLRDRRGLGIVQTNIVRQAADTLRLIRGMPPSKFAIIVDPGADYGMMRMVQMLSDGGWAEIALFFELEPAIEWLRLPMSSPVG